MSKPSRTRRVLRLLLVAVTGAAIALGGVFVVQSRSDGASDAGAPPTTPTTVATSQVGWLAAVPYCVLFLRWTQAERSINGTAQAADSRHHLSWSLPMRGAVNGSNITIDVGAPGLCGSHGTRLTGTMSSDSLLLDFAQPHSTPLSVKFQQGTVADFNEARAAALVQVDPTGASPAPKSLVSAVTSIPHNVSSQVGRGNATQPAKLSAPVLANPDGRPRIVWVGAEYCSSCAAERWPMVVALSRFGVFSNLRVTTSTALDGYPNTRSFSFYGSTYTSPYITFEAVELFTNIPWATGFTPLDAITPEQQALVDKFDKPPYVDPSSRGALPFIDFANQYSIVGNTFSPAVLRAENADSIAVALFDPTTTIAKGVIGSANDSTAAICKITKNQPVSVCSDPVVQNIESQLG
jgi:hypothetical protein